jgi:CheY-like chemotaxis protein
MTIAINNRPHRLGNQSGKHNEARLIMPNPAVQLGAAGYIVKPFNPATLLRSVEQVTTKSHAQ